VCGGAGRRHARLTSLMHVAGILSCGCQSCQARAQLCNVQVWHGPAALWHMLQATSLWFCWE
jgi:hypothetical protein